MHVKTSKRRLTTRVASLDENSGLNMWKNWLKAAHFHCLLSNSTFDTRGGFDTDDPSGGGATCADVRRGMGEVREAVVLTKVYARKLES